MLKLFVIKPSRMFALLLLAVHLPVMISVCLTPLVFWARLCLSLLILLSLFHHLYRYVLLRARHSWRSFSLNQRQLVIGTRGGETLNGDVTHRTVVTALCVVLCARLDGYKLPVCQVIFRDALPDDVFRELRVRLRFSQ